MHTAQIAIGYARVSTPTQKEQGASLELQCERITSFCNAKGWILRKIHVDAGWSARSLDRPALRDLFDDLRLGDIDTLVVLKLDRLTRSVRDLGFLVDELLGSVSLAAVEESIDTGTANGRMIVNLMTSIAQWERETIGERTSAAMQFKRRVERKWMGRPPFGFRIDKDSGKLVEVPSRIKQIQYMKRARRAGRSLSWIADKTGTSKSLVQRLVSTDMRTIRSSVRRFCRE